jgi:NMD protein affecting ribosome stability and mRNA decay
MTTQLHSHDLAVVACSLCLRVFHDGSWMEAEEAIRRLRSYELPAPLALEAGICDECTESVRARREGSSSRRLATSVAA